MRIDVIGRNLDITDAIRDHAEQKAEKLLKFFDAIQQISVTIVQEDHANHANFDVELVVDVERHANFVAHAKGDDLYATIDQAVSKTTRQLTDYKEKLKLGKR